MKIDSITISFDCQEEYQTALDIAQQTLPDELKYCMQAYMQCVRGTERYYITLNEANTKPGYVFNLLWRFEDAGII